jgi:predicted RNA-binding Zn ribbon-like protein
MDVDSHVDAPGAPGAPDAPDAPDALGAPVRGEPLSIEFANTRYAVRGTPRDGIGTEADLRAWLAAESAALGLGADARLAPIQPGEPGVGAFLELRDAIRSLLRAAADGQPLDQVDVSVLNRSAAMAPSWPELKVTDDSCAIIERTGAGIAESALGAIARDAVKVLSGPLHLEVRECHAPGCILFFVRNHPRREWCSAGCGNRARAARHYRKQHAG